MGGSPNIPKPESMKSLFSTYMQYLPGMLSATSSQIPETAQNQLNATLATQPMYNALNLQQAQNYSVPLAKVGQEVSDSNALAGARTNYNQLTGAGGAAAKAAEALNRETNQNYYKIQDASSAKARDLVDSFNMMGLSPGEQNAVERSTNQRLNTTGNLGLNNTTNTVNNAMSFGNAFRQKQAGLASALGAANQTAASAINSGFNPVTLALGQPQQSVQGNFGTGQFNNVNAGTQNNSAGNAIGFGQGMFGQMSSMNNANASAYASMSNANSPAALMQGIGGLGGLGNLDKAVSF